MEEMAVGGGAGSANAGPSSADQADHSGPLEQRLVAKNWKVKATAFDDLRKLCEAAEVNSKDGVFLDHVGQWKIYLKEANPQAL